MPRLLVFALALVALPLHADTLSDLKAAVGRLNGRQPIHATYATDSNVQASGKFANQASVRNVTAEVTHDGSGVTIAFPQALIDKSRSDDEDDLLSIRLMSVADALDFRGALLDLLNHGAPIEEKRVVFRGKAARQLVLKLNFPPRKSGNSITIGSVKIAEDRLTVWVGDDNLPLAAERFKKTSAGFLMFHADSTDRSSYTFSRSGDRLILARLETNGSGSAMGQNIAQKFVQTMTVH